MASITYGSRTPLANVSRLHSVANGEARTFGEIDNSSGLLDYHIRLAIPISASATSGTYSVYLVESQDGAEWTDNIDPTADTGNVAAKIKDAKLLAVSGTVYNASTRTEAELHINVSNASVFGGLPKFFGFVVLNNSGQSIPASGADGDSQSITVS